MTRMVRVLRTLLWEFSLPLVLIVVWWGVSARSGSLYYPPLSRILTRFRELWLFDRFGSDFVPSLVNLAVGYLSAVVVGIGLGVAMGLTRWLREAVNPVVQFLRALPAVALLPLAIQLLGIGWSMKAGVIFFGALWPILLNTIDGVRSIDPLVTEMTRSYRITRRERIRHVVLPAAGPQIFVGLRASLSVAVILLLASELVGSSAGVGHFVLQAQRQFNITDMWAGMVLLGLLGYLLNLGLQVIERRVLGWHIKRR
ncbi:ABC transporter permease [Actinomadura fibrosa]|uniref:ABC transporter permease n=1 Tax=Actinomadura fibrosa TaxID=111802 RepID=A0ABW2Y3P2_9ACTN|nr:ABC transporter permease [Actinomadura fibrosa]